MLDSLRRRAKLELGLRSVSEAHTGAVTFIQRFDSAIRLNVHAHTDALNGVYVLEQDQLVFHSLGEPSAEDIGWVARRSFERAKRLLRRRGLLDADQISRLCALVPPPRFNMIRYHGLFDSNAQLRRRIVPAPADNKHPVQLKPFDKTPRPSVVAAELG